MNSSPGGAAAIRSGAQRKRGRFGEEEQGSQRSFRRQAEANEKVNWPEGPRLRPQADEDIGPC